MIVVLRFMKYGLLFMLSLSAFASDETSRCDYFLAAQNPRPLKVLITAGGTKELIDDVRFVSNFSSGAFGRGFALAAAERGHQVVLLAPKELPKLVGPLPENVELRPFVSTADLQRRLEEAAKEGQWDVIIHSAAVSDYTPAKFTDGKISSNEEVLWVPFVQTPKLIRSMRQQFGRTFIVGFKLLSKKSADERYQIAMKQLADCRTNLCVENDLTEISSGAHKVRLITPEGGAIPVPVSDKLAVAKSVLNFIEKRQNVHWYQTLQDQSLPQKTERSEPGRLLSLAQEAGLLPNSSGNVSMRLNDGLVAITPRGVDKSKIKSEDFLVVKVDTEQRKVFVNNAVKPSIDSSVAGAMYQAFPELISTLHSHSPWFLGGIKTTYPYPCGVKEEGDEVIHSVKSSPAFETGKPFVVRLVDHGYMLGLTPELSVEKLEQQWKEALADIREHWNEVGVSEADLLVGGQTVAILAKEGIVGTVRVHPDQTISPRLLPAYQGKGYGRQLIERIKELGLTVKTVNECKVVDFYKKMGFEVVREEGRVIYLKAR